MVEESFPNLESQAEEVNSIETVMNNGVNSEKEEQEDKDELISDKTLW